MDMFTVMNTVTGMVMVMFKIIVIVMVKVMVIDMAKGRFT